MKRIADNRRENLRLLIEQTGGVNKLARELGYKNASFLSQMAGPNPTREVTEKSARAIEEAKGLEPGVLDQPPPIEARPLPVARATRRSPKALPVPVATATPIVPRPPQAAAASEQTVALVSEVIRLVGQAYSDEGVTIEPVKFSDLVALALADTLELGRAPRPEQLARLVRLATK